MPQRIALFKLSLFICGFLFLHFLDALETILFFIFFTFFSQVNIYIRKIPLSSRVFNSKELLLLTCS